MSVGRGLSLMGCVARPSRVADEVTIFSRLLDRGPNFSGSRPKTSRMNQTSHLTIRVPDKTQDPSSFLGLLLAVFVANSPSSRERPSGREKAKRNDGVHLVRRAGALRLPLPPLCVPRVCAPSSSTSLRSPSPLLASCRFIRAPILSTISLDGGGHFDLVPPIRVLVGWIESFTLRCGERRCAEIRHGRS
jgi:hypothetical protein